MKIAFIGQKGIPAKSGGIEKHVQELSTRLADRGFDVSVYARPHYTDKKLKKFKGVNVVSLPSLNTKNLDAITHTFIATIHAIFAGYDVIHYHGVGPALLSFLPRIFSPKSKVVATFHCQDQNHQKWGRFAKAMLALGEWTACKFPHETITTSKVLQKYVAKKFHCEAEYIPNGVSYADQIIDPSILKTYGLQKNDYILSVGRLVKHKGIHTLIKAYQKSGLDKRLVIVGSGANTNDYVRYLIDLSAGDKNIIFTGEQTGSGLHTLFKNAYLFVQPSQSEGLSIALLEAMAYGVPTLTSDIPENLEATNRSGLAFKNKNVFSLANQLKRADREPKLLAESAKSARRHISREYDWEDIADKVAELYQENKKTSLIKELATVKK